MSKLELTISTDYVRNWNIWSAIRELIQNTADANDIGYPMKVIYNPDRKEPTLTLINEGITIDRDALLLGTTTKADDERQRGCFGEGMKLGWLTLLRAGLKIWIKSGGEKWVPTISYSDTYKSELLTIETSKATYENCVKVEVRGLAENLWEEMREKILFKPGIPLLLNEYIQSGKDKILTKEELRGHLFARGLYVGYLPGDYWFGYDFHELELDRDRKLADPWNMKTAVRSAINRASLPTDELWVLLNNDRWEETRVIADSWNRMHVEGLSSAITEKFHQEYGYDCVPVENTSQSIEAEQCGLKARVVSKAIKVLIEFIEGKFEDKKNSRALEHSRIYAIDELTEEERTNFCWAHGLLKLVQKPPCISIVDFCGEYTLGAYKRPDVYLAKKILTNRSRLISTLVHEVAHIDGTDGTVEHRNECERLFGELIDGLSQ
jgi:hypothetical protein